VENQANDHDHDDHNDHDYAADHDHASYSHDHIAANGPDTAADNHDHHSGIVVCEHMELPFSHHDYHDHHQEHKQQQRHHHDHGDWEGGRALVGMVGDMGPSGNSRAVIGRRGVVLLPKVLFITRQSISMCKAFLLMALFLAAMAAPAMAGSTQQTNNIRMSPYYFASLPQDTNQSMWVRIAPPDNVASVTSALFHFKVFTSGSTTTYTLFVNNKTCGTYLVDTRFANSGQYEIAFDCTSLVQKQGNYSVQLRASVNSGSFYGWLDITYTNKPPAVIGITTHGTEYVEGDDARVWLQLLDESKAPINNVACLSTIYFPNNSVLIDDVLLQYLDDSDGIYFHDFTAPDTDGVYMISTQCRIPQTVVVDEFTDFNNTESYGNVTIAGGKVNLLSYTLNTSTGSKSPSSYGDDYAQWTNPSWAIGSDDSRSTTSVNGEKNDWYNFSFNLPSNYAVSGITVYLEGSTVAGSTTGVDVELSWDGGASYTSTSHGYTTSSATDAVRTLGSGTDLWSRTWTASELSNANFRLRLNKKGDAGFNHRIDNIQVDINYTVPYNSTSGYLRSKNITLNGTSWANFYVGDSVPAGASVLYSILNASASPNGVLCAGVTNGYNISACADSEPKIKLLINLTGNGSATPAIDRYWIDYTISEYQEVRGSGEVHIGRPQTCNVSEITDQIAAHNESVFGKLYGIQDEIMSVNNTVKSVGMNLTSINATLSSQIGDALTAMGNIPALVWAYATRTLTSFGFITNQTFNNTYNFTNIFNSTLNMTVENTTNTNIYNNTEIYNQTLNVSIENTTVSNTYNQTLNVSVENITNENTYNNTNVYNNTLNSTVIYNNTENVTVDLTNVMNAINGMDNSMAANFTQTNGLIISVNNTVGWWGNQLNATSNYWGTFLYTTVDFWGNALETKIDNIIMGNVTVTAQVDYDEIALTTMQYLKALQKMELI
jgi:hypothetical protein